MVPLILLTINKHLYDLIIVNVVENIKLRCKVMSMFLIF